MKKLCRVTHDNIHHQDHRQGTFAKATEDMLSIHERMAENGLQFSLSLHQMHEDLLEDLARISHQSYPNDFELHKDLSYTLKRLNDGHCVYINYCYDCEPGNPLFNRCHMY